MCCRAGTRAPNHFVGHVEPDDLSGLVAVGDDLCHQAARPSRAAAQVEHAVARLQFHPRQRLLDDADVVVLHLLAAALLGPLVELLAQSLVRGNGFLVDHDVLGDLECTLTRIPLSPKIEGSVACRPVSELPATTERFGTIVELARMDPAMPVGARTGAVFRRSSLAVAPRFL